MKTLTSILDCELKLLRLKRNVSTEVSDAISTNPWLKTLVRIDGKIRTTIFPVKEQVFDETRRLELR
jgi:hypothetical protein